jgi:hypothetical protein
MVGVQGFEPWTLCSQSRCATRLRYTPNSSVFMVRAAGFEPAIYRFQTEDVGQATLRPDHEHIEKLTTNERATAFIQREQSHNGCHILVDLWRVELHTAHCKCTNHSHGKPKFFSDSVCSACVSEPVWADLNAEASPFPCLPAHVPLNHVYDPSLAESCHQSARSTGFFGSFRRSFTADFRLSSLGKSSSVRYYLRRVSTLMSCEISLK